MKKLNNVLEVALVIAVITLLGVSTEIGADIRRQSLTAHQPATWPESPLVDLVLVLMAITVGLALACGTMSWLLRKKPQCNE